MSKVTAKQKYWSEQLLKADAFEGSLGQYAQTQNIPVQTLYHWRSYFKRPSAIESKTKPAFAQVVSAPVTDFCVRLQMGKIQLQFARLPDVNGYLSLLSRVIPHDAPRPGASSCLFVR